MSKEYEIQCDDFNYFIEAEPVVTDETFDHGLGVEVIMACTEVNILSVSRDDLIISDKEFRADEQAFNELLDKVIEDYSAGGVF